MPASRNNLESYWMPFTANRAFKRAPRLMASAKDMHYTTTDGRQILDGSAGLWCVNAGHAREPIVAAIQRAAATLDYAPAFQVGHPGAFELAERLSLAMPGALNRVFFTNSGSEACETALKIALAYHHARGEGRRLRLVGRERGYHGVNFGGMSVGGLANNRRVFGQTLPFVDHLPHTHSREHAAFTKGQPEWGGHLAESLEDMVAAIDTASCSFSTRLSPPSEGSGRPVPRSGLALSPI